MSELVLTYKKAEATAVKSMLKGGPFMKDLYEQIFPDTIINSFNADPKDATYITSVWKSLEEKGWQSVLFSKVKYFLVDVNSADDGKTFFKCTYYWPQDSKEVQVVLVCGGKNNKRKGTSTYDGLANFFNAMQAIYVKNMAYATQPLQTLIPGAVRENDSSSSSSSSSSTSSSSCEALSIFSPIVNRRDSVLLTIEDDAAELKALMGDELWNTSLKELKSLTKLDELKKPTWSNEKLVQLLCKMRYEMSSLERQVELLTPASSEELQRRFMAELSMDAFLQYCLGKVSNI